MLPRLLRAISPLWLWIMISASMTAQPPDKEALRFFYLDEKTSDDLEMGRERIFEGAALYGFMNGGSELFLEYGFQQLLEQRFTYNQVPFIAEYYLMDSPENAYGIYSVHAYKCRRVDERFPVECLIPGLLQLYHGHLYINLKCLNREIDAQPLLDTLATLILLKNPLTQSAQTLQIHDQSIFPPPYSGALYYVCGDLGLSQANISWAPYFLPYAHYALWLYIDPQTQKSTAYVRFATESDAQTFCAQNEERFSLERNGNEVIILPAPSNLANST